MTTNSSRILSNYPISWNITKHSSQTFNIDYKSCSKDMKKFKVLILRQD